MVPCQPQSSKYELSVNLVVMGGAVEEYYDPQEIASWPHRELIEQGA